jgi:hypothetical protein
MTTDYTDGETLENLTEYLRLNNDASTPEVHGATDTNPLIWSDGVDAVLKSDKPHWALETPYTGAPEIVFSGQNPTNCSRQVKPPIVY